MTSLDVALDQYFGFDHFRAGQRTLVSAILNGRSVLGVMPTGAGKSLCFQLPAVMRDGVAIVVSPLCALIVDQMTKLLKAGIPATALYGWVS